MILFLACAFSALSIATFPLMAGNGGGPFVGGFLRGTLDNETITGIDRMQNGDVVVCGWTDSYETWDGVGGYDETQNGSIDAFVAVFSADLETVKAFTFFGGTADDKAIGVRVGPQGTIIIAGSTESKNLPTTAGAFSMLPVGYMDGFIVSFSSDLSSLKACTYFGGRADDEIIDIIDDDAGNVYICGRTKSAYGFPTNNGYDKIYDGGYDAFLAGLTPNFSAVIFSSYYGGTSDDVFNKIAVSTSGDLACVGTTRSQDYATYPNVNPLYWWWQKDRPYDWTYNGGETDVVLTIFSDNGSVLIVSTLFGGMEADEGVSVIYNTAGEVIVLGNTQSTDIPIVGGSQQAIRGQSDVFVAKFNSTARSLQASTYLGGDGGENLDGATMLTGDQFALFGTTTSSDITAVGAGSRNNLNGGLEPFVSIGTTNSIAMLSTVGGTKDDVFTRALTDGDRGLIFVGSSSSPFINIDSKTLEAVGEYPTTDALAIRYQRGMIELTTPYGGEHVCLDQPFNVGWSRLDMEITDRYRVEATTDLINWIPLSDYTAATSVQIVINDPSYLNKNTTLRVVSSRDHASRMASPLSIEPRPAISSSPSDATLCAGQITQLSVEATGYGLRYVWRKDGTVLQGQTKPFLLLGPANSETTGRYDVMVTADCGINVSSSPADVIIAEETIITSSPRDTTIKLGRNLELTVTAQGFALNYIWYRNNDPIPYATSSKLTIASITSLDAGRYAVRVSGLCGEEISKEFVVNVDQTTDVGEESAGKIALFPNPAFEEVLISTPPFVGTLKLVDQIGTEVDAIVFESEVTNIRVDLSHVGSGRYTLVMMPLNRTSIYLPLLIVR